MATDTETTVKVRVNTALTPPGRYNVIFKNDNLTPFDFVTMLLTSIFGHDKDTATEITNIIHHEGRGIVGTYTWQIAEQKQSEAVIYARTSGYPLDVVIEAAI